MLNGVSEATVDWCILKCSGGLGINRSGPADLGWNSFDVKNNHFHLVSVNICDQMKMSDSAELSVSFYIT